LYSAIKSEDTEAQMKFNTILRAENVQQLISVFERSRCCVVENHLRCRCMF